MSEFSSQIALDHIKCQDHNEVANLICLDKQCDKRGIICGLCQYADHKEHEIKPFKYFLHELTRSQKHSNQIALISSQIDLNHSEISSASAKIANIEDKIQFERVLNNYMSQVYSRINSEFSIQKNLRSFFQRNQTPSTKKINQFIAKYQLHDYEPEIIPQKPLTNQQKYLLHIKEMMKQKKDDFQDLLKGKPDIKDILGMFTFTETKQKVNYTFSEEHKHTSMKIIDKLTVTQAHNYSSNFALIQPILIGKKKQFAKKTIKIKIQKLNSWINLGVCIKSKAVANSYYFNTQDVGHGAYTISNDGYSWHNIDSSLNSYYHGWDFKQGDVVQMTYDPKTKTIKYQKQNSDKDHQLACDPVPGEEMYFCVTLNTHDESVSIVS